MGMSTNTQPRQPRGTPVGGQFAGKSNPESEVALSPDEPEKIVLPDGTQEWRLNGRLHRTDGPALIWTDGSEASTTPP